MKKDLLLIVLWFLICLLFGLITSFEVINGKLLIVILDILILWMVLLYLLKNKVIGIILYFITLIISIILIYYSVVTIISLNKISKNYSDINITYYLLSNDEEIKNVGYLKDDIYVDQAIIKLRKKYDFNIKEYSDKEEMLKDLDNNYLQAILVSQKIDKYKNTYEFKIKVKEKIKSQNSKLIFLNMYDNNFNYNYIISINTSINTNDILIVRIPSKFKIKNQEIEKIDSLKEKIEGLENIYNIKINYYIKVDKKMVDKVRENDEIKMDKIFKNYNALNTNPDSFYKTNMNKKEIKKLFNYYFDNQNKIKVIKKTAYSDNIDEIKKSLNTK